MNKPPRVHILASCLDESKIEMTTLVFKTVRVGFPEAEIVVHRNGLVPTESEIVSKAATLAGANPEDICIWNHGHWIEYLIDTEQNPFWICDTDMIFYDKVEHLTSDAALFGYFIPEFEDQFSNATTRSRLHTSLLRIDPVKVRAAMDLDQANSNKFTPISSLTHPRISWHNGKRIFHDTMSMAYHRLGGEAFTPEIKDRYFHFHFGTIEDLVLPKLDGGVEMAAARKAAMENPGLAHGCWRGQDRYFASRAARKPRVIAPIDPKDGEDAVKINKEVCLGNQQAMTFNDLWYSYAHGIDDLIDTMEDGRPKMGAEEVLELFVLANLLYNHPFYIANRGALQHLILNITNTYADNVAWEKSPVPGLRAMGDVFRTCGNELFIAVAMICGGWRHARKWSQFIKDRDWHGQHDEQGNPT